MKAQSGELLQHRQIHSLRSKSLRVPHDEDTEEQCLHPTSSKFIFQPSRHSDASYHPVHRKTRAQSTGHAYPELDLQPTKPKETTRYQEQQHLLKVLLPNASDRQLRTTTTTTNTTEMYQAYTHTCRSPPAAAHSSLARTNQRISPFQNPTSNVSPHHRLIRRSPIRPTKPASLRHVDLTQVPISRSNR